MAARDNCVILNFNTQKSFKVASVSSTMLRSVILYTKGEPSNEGSKGLTLLSAAFSRKSAALSAVWETDWISLLNFDSSFPVTTKLNISNSRILFVQTGGICCNLQGLDTLFVAATHDLFSKIRHILLSVTAAEYQHLWWPHGLSWSKYSLFECFLRLSNVTHTLCLSRENKVQCFFLVLRLWE